MNARLFSLAPAPAWHLAALCRRDKLPKDMSPDWWFSSSPYRRRVAAAYCADCPVRETCLEEALLAEGGKARDDRHGIYGGMSARQRRREYEKRTRTALAARKAAA